MKGRVGNERRASTQIKKKKRQLNFHFLCDQIKLENGGVMDDFFLDSLA